MLKRIRNKGGCWRPNEQSHEGIRIRAAVVDREVRSGRLREIENPPSEVLSKVSTRKIILSSTPTQKGGGVGPSPIYSLQGDTPFPPTAKTSGWIQTGDQRKDAK